MRQHASSRENDTLPRLISAHFFPSRAARGRCDKQGAEGNPHRAQAPRRQPEVCHRSADSRYVCCAQSTASLHVTLSTRLQNSQLTSYLIHAVHAGVAYTWFLQRGWLPMATTMTGLVVCVTMALVAMETAAHGRWCRPIMYICTVTVLPGSCAIGRVEGQNYRFFETHRAIVTLSLS